MKTTTYSIPSLLVGLAALDHFRDAASRCAPVVCKGDLPVVVSNLNTAFRAIAPRLGELPELLPKHDLRPMMEMPNLAQALLYATNRVAPAASSGEIARQLGEARRLREPMLLVAEVLATMGPLPAERVAKIRAGTGPYDLARDLVDLVGLYREYGAALAGKTPFSERWFTEAEAVGTWLMANITPTGAAKAPAADVDAAALLRDQLWAMLLERDVKLRVVAAVLFEGKAEAMVPPLQSRVVSAGAEVTAAPVEGEKPAEPVVAEPVVEKPAEPVVAEPVAAKPVAPGNSTPPAPMRPKSAQTRETRATARRKR